MSAPRVIGLIPDAGPLVDFATPNEGSVILGTEPSYEVAWTELSASGVVSRSLQRVRGAVNTPETCNFVTMANDGAPSTSSSPLTVTDLESGYCYRWQLTLTDRVGNANTYYSGELLVDTTTTGGWAAPDVVISGTAIFQAAVNDPAYFVPGTGTATLTATVTVPPSGITCVQFSNLTPVTGWTPGPELPNCATSAPYTQTLTFDATAVPATIDVTAQSSTGATSETRTVSLISDSLPPTGDFTWPEEGDDHVQGHDGRCPGHLD